jgi:valyl-tRNA synthetase
MNKLWNAARFVHMNLKDNEIPTIDIDKQNLDLPERWILYRLNQTIDQYNRRLSEFHFNEAAKTLYEFTWSDFCDWYVEIAKTRFFSDNDEKAEIARAVAVRVLKNILKLLHPYAPFMTEELWEYFKFDSEPDLIKATWPDSSFPSANQNELGSMDILKEVITAVRTIRSRMNVPPASKANVLVRSPNGSTDVLKKYESIIKSLAKIENMTLGESIEKPDHSATAVIRQMEIFIPLEGLINLDVERARLTKRQSELDGFIIQIQKKLSNDNFLSKAPKDVVQNEKEKLADMEAELERINSNLEMLS